MSKPRRQGQKRGDKVKVPPTKERAQEEAMEDEFDNTPEFESEEEEQPEQVEPAEEGAEVEVDAEPEQEAAEEPPPPKHVPLKALEDERRKRQEFEEENRRLKEAQAQPQRVATPQTVEEIFDADPESVLGYLRSEIATKQAQLDREYDPALERELIQLRDTREDLRDRQTLAERRQRQMQERIAPVEAEIKTIIPDSKKAAEIKAFAVENGLDAGLVEAMLDPRQAGPNAAAFSKFMANLHAKVTQPATRRVSSAPPPVSTVGGRQGAVAVDTSKMSDAEWHEHERQRLAKMGRLY